MPLVIPSSVGGLPYAAPCLTDALTRLRQDLFDQTSMNPSRWQDSDLTRAIDRALDQYSFVVPWIQVALVQAVGGVRLVAVPTVLNPSGVVGSSGSGPSWWVEQCEYPTGFFPRFVVPFLEMVQPCLGVPTAPVLAQAGGTGGLNGQYNYVVTYNGIGGETAISPAGYVSGLSNGSVLVTLPLGPLPYCLGRNLYRTNGTGQPPYQLVTTIADDTTTSYLDVTADGSLGVQAPAADSTAGVPLVEMQLSDAELPDPTDPGTVQLTYASKHILAANGTTVPEQHHDVVLLGAAAYACLAYQVTANDLFDYQDGVMRDQVHQAKTPEHWLAVGNNLLAQFKGRLEDVKQQRDAAYAAVSQWGAVARRWSWI
jgi:hypothetical protein